MYFSTATCSHYCVLTVELKYNNGVVNVHKVKHTVLSEHDLKEMCCVCVSSILSLPALPVQHVLLAWWVQPKHTKLPSVEYASGVLVFVGYECKCHHLHTEY